MPKNKKSKPFSVIKEIKAMARERIGVPPGEKVIPNKKRKEAGKRSAKLARLLSGEE